MEPPEARAARGIAPIHEQYIRKVLPKRLSEVQVDLKGAEASTAPARKVATGKKSKRIRKQARLLFWHRWRQQTSMLNTCLTDHCLG